MNVANLFMFLVVVFLVISVIGLISELKRHEEINKELERLLNRKKNLQKEREELTKQLMELNELIQKTK